MESVDVTYPSGKTVTWYVEKSNIRWEAYRITPKRCEQCARDKYSWITVRKLKEEIIPLIQQQDKVTLATFTLGRAVIVPVEEAEDEAQRLRILLKDRFGAFTRSKWWRNRVEGWFYTIEVKETPQEGSDGVELTKLHPHVHCIMEHHGYEDWQKAASQRGLGEYTWAKRVRRSAKHGTRQKALEATIGYVMKYALKGYGDSRLKGRYYERGGTFRAKRKE